jgi:dephospho-CoA kinase
VTVGVTGRYCAGKNAAAEFLRDRGYRVVDVDRVGHEVLSERAAEVAARFGDAVLADGGQIDRRALGRLVFSDPDALRSLERILHPEMVRRVAEIADREARAVINAAILFHMGLHRYCDLVICVRALFVVRLVRALRRDGLGLFEATRRLRAQRGICPKRPDPAVDTSERGFPGASTGSSRAKERCEHRWKRVMSCWSWPRSVSSSS